MYKEQIYHVGSEPGFDMTRSPKVLKLPGSETVEAEAAVKAIEINKAELKALWKKHWEFFKAKYMGPGYHNTEQDAETVADNIIRDWKKEIADRPKRQQEREQKEEAKKVARLARWIKGVLTTGRKAGHDDNEVIEQIKTKAKANYYSESQISAALQANGIMIEIDQKQVAN